MLYSGENCNCNGILCGEGWERQCNELCFRVGKNVTVMVYGVVRVGKGQRNELCFIVGKIVTVIVYCVVRVGKGSVMSCAL